MPARAPIRHSPLLVTAILTSTCAVGGLAAQAPPGPSSLSSLPATTPTSLPAPIAATAPSAAIARKPQRPTVTYASGLLNVRANDSSLNSILREISRLTGMTVTGGVADQRVFGNYGPAEPSVLIATLLDGTGTNIFLKEATDNSPAELTLTPRNGGATPPSPSSAQYADSDEPPQGSAGRQLQGQPLQALPYDGRPGYAQMPPSATQQMPPRPFANPNDGGLSGPVPMPPPINNPLGDPNTVTPTASTFPITNSVPADSLPTPSTAQSVSGIVDAPAGPASNSTTSNITAAAQADANSSTTPTATTPSGTVTAEQIFQQLQALRRAAAAQNAAGSSTTTPAATPQPTTNPQ